MVELVDEAEVLVAPAALFGGAHRGKVPAHQLDMARTGRVQPTQQMQQRALARTGSADDGQRFAGTHLQVHATQHLHVQRAFLEALVQAGAAEYEFTHSAAPRPG